VLGSVYFGSVCVWGRGKGRTPSERKERKRRCQDPPNVSLLVSVLMGMGGKIPSFSKKDWIRDNSLDESIVRIIIIIGLFLYEDF
jgi:hypothetical protein